jgi:hypothetical protein
LRSVSSAHVVIMVAALMTKSDVFQPLRYCGRSSIVIIPRLLPANGRTRIALLKTS